MSTPSKKPPAGTASGRRPLGDSPGTARGTTPPATANGLGRTRSLRGSPLPARATQRGGAGGSNLSTSSAVSNAEEDARAEAVALLDDLKERLRKAETVSEQFQRQAQVLQLKLDEAHSEQGKLEEKLHENDERLEALENAKSEAQKQMREMESIYEAERSAMTKDREEMANREEEMQVIIQRLKDSLSQKSTVDEERRMSRRCKSIDPSPYRIIVLIAFSE